MKIRIAVKKRNYVVEIKEEEDQGDVYQTGTIYEKLPDYDNPVGIIFKEQRYGGQEMWVCYESISFLGDKAIFNKETEAPDPRFAARLYIKCIQFYEEVEEDNMPTGLLRSYRR
jgi:hypothetical protein